MSHEELTERNRKLLSEAYAKMIAGDAADFVSLLDPDVVLHEVESLPYGGVYQGLEAVLPVVALVGALVDFPAVVIDDLIVDGDRAVCLVRLPLVGTGEVVEVSELVWMRDGMIVKIRPYFWNTVTVVDALASAEASR